MTAAVSDIAAGFDKSGTELLADFLGSDDAPAAMPLIVLDGFLTGVLAAPGLIRPKTWLNEIWGGEEPRFADVDHANAILGAIMAEYNSINTGVTPELGGDPALLELPFEATELELASLWSKGFMTAVAVDPKAWKPVLDSADLCLMLAPVMTLAGPPGELDEPMIDDEAELQLAIQQSAELLADAVKALIVVRLSLRGGLTVSDVLRPLRKSRGKARSSKPRVVLN